MLWAVIVIFIVALDQFTKYVVSRNIPFETMIPVIDKFFYMTFIRNSGAAWSIFQNGRFFFIPLTIIVSGVLVYVLYKAESKLLSLSLSFILGGAVGNLIDRIIKGSVVDFFEFHFGTYRFPVFNAADSFVVIGTILLAVYLLFIHKENKTESKA